jgi:hypothetical protein
VFGRKSRAERLKERAGSRGAIPIGSLAAAYAGARPLLERLLYDDDLRDNIRTFIEAAHNILEELSGERPSEVVARLWDDDKLRKQVEAAAGAAQQGSRRLRGERVREGGSGKWLLLLLGAGAAFLFLNPKTGPEARRLAREAYSAVTSAS